MLYLYDIALKQHLKNVYSSVYLAERTKIFKKVREEMASKDGNIKLPLIGLWRIENTLETDRRNYAEFKRGFRHDVVNNEIIRIKSINLPLTYQLDIIAGSHKDCDDLLVDTILYLTENPIITFNRNGISFSFQVDLMDLSISTDYGSFSEAGSLYNQTLTVMVPESRILFTENKKIFHDLLIEINLENAEDEIEYTHIVEINKQ